MRSYLTSSSNSSNGRCISCMSGILATWSNSKCSRTSSCARVIPRAGSPARLLQQASPRRRSRPMYFVVLRASTASRSTVGSVWLKALCCRSSAGVWPDLLLGLRDACSRSTDPRFHGRDTCSISAGLVKHADWIGSGADLDNPYGHWMTTQSAC
ncbi:hypothetical protein K491DRAFT_350531 [Lophiostoma macrostomum CBS 122681]|uniref:Uncharacterized protein n=1 Tax=Lophiostoma macrostomum CBS 122681 TaxID=1314788 RepID=A0A6A6TCA8_9PLEO|nr:hypothetical protein K491DRAFT_350531 [Lophiostoma macrostomum CBS 122681]